MEGQDRVTDTRRAIKCRYEFKSLILQKVQKLRVFQKLAFFENHLKISDTKANRHTRKQLTIAIHSHMYKTTKGIPAKEQQISNVAQQKVKFTLEELLLLIRASLLFPTKVSK